MVPPDQLAGQAPLVLEDQGTGPQDCPGNWDDHLISFSFICFRLRKLLTVNENEYFAELQLKEEAL